MRFGIFRLAAVVVMAFAVQAQASVVDVDGLTIDDSQFATGAASSGTIYIPGGGSLASAVTGLDLDTYASINSGDPTPSSITLTFAGPVLNGAGNDFILFEISPLEDAWATVDGGSLATAVKVTMAASTASVDGGPAKGINIGYINLDDFGAASVTSLTIWGEVRDPDGTAWDGPDLAGAAFLSEIPEPTTLSIFGLLSMVGLAVTYRRRNMA
jgi:hypothetical protein